MGFKKFISLFTALSLLFTAVPFASVAADDTGDTEITEPVEPTDPVEPVPPVESVFEIIGSTIKRDTEFFELGVKVNPMAEGFLSAALVLQYDSSLITPASWSESAIDMSDRTDWRNVAVLPAIAPKELSGKTAFAYQEGRKEPEEPTPTETPAPTVTPDPTETPAPTNPDAGGETVQSDEPGQTTEPTPTPDPTQEPDPTVTPDPTETPGPVEPEEPEAFPSKGYLYLSADAAFPIQTMPGNGRIITVRFRYAGEDKESRQASKQKVIDGFLGEKIVTLAPHDIAAASHAGEMLVYYTGVDDPEKGVTEYYYTTEAPAEGTEGQLLAKERAYSLKLEQDAQSADSGGSDPSKFAPLVFFDWDESTLLGSMVVDSGMEQEELISTINTYTANFMPPNEDGSLLDMSEWNDEKAKAYTEYRAEVDENKKAKYPLASHNGYTFGKWIPFDSDDFTVYGEAVDAANANVMVDIPTPTDPDYTNISGGLILKTAYIANSSMNKETLSSGDLRYYTISNGYDKAGGEKPDPNDGYFNRFGESTSYSVKVKVSRFNRNNQPIYRPRQTALRVDYLVGTTHVFALSNLKNVDEQITEVAVPIGATNVTVTVIDAGGISNWVNGAGARSGDFTVEKADIELYGNITFLNEFPDTVDITSNTFTAPVSATWKSAGLTVKASASARRTAVRDIAVGQAQKLEKEGKKYLTQQEMQNAISNNGNYLGAG